MRIVLRMSVIDDYFSDLDAPARAAFEHIRDLAVEEVPEAEPGTSYGMPALRYKQKPLLGFRAAAQHLSIFPFSPEAIDAVRDRLTGFDLAKGTIRFAASKPLPDDVVRQVVRERAAQISGGTR